MTKFDVSDFNIINFDEIDSTSTYLKSNYQSLKDFTICFANYQTLGRGRYQRKWMAPRGECLLFSLLIKNKKLIKEFPSFSLMSAYYVLKAVKKYVPSGEFSVKWPNDIYLNSKKLAGILLESTSYNGELESLIIGIGMNINVTDFDEEIAFKATSLRKESGFVQNIEEVKKDVLNGLKEMILAVINDDHSYIEEIRKINFLKNKVVSATINEEIKEVKVIDINDDNTLLVDLNGEKISLSVGEVLPLKS